MFDNTDIISQYSNEQALTDGTKHDVTNMANEAGIRCPVYITSGVHALCTPPKSNKIQSYEGRLWDVLSVFRWRTRGTKDSFFEFKVKIGRRNETLWAVLDGDGITIMKPDEY